MRARPWKPGPRSLAAVAMAVLFLLPARVAAQGPGSGPMRLGAGDSQIDEASPDDRSGGEPAEALTTVGALRAYVAGSLARYDEVKSGLAGFRRQGWFPSCWLRDPEADLELVAEAGGTRAVTAHISCARRDIDQRLVIAPLERFLLPGADRRFFAELVADLADASPEVGRARLRFWFASLEGGGRMVWEDRGSLAIAAAKARRVPRGKRTQEAIWPLLEENTVPASLWPE